MTGLTKIAGSSNFERPEHPNCVMARIAEVRHAAQTTRMIFENGDLIMVDIGWGESPMPGDVLMIGAMHVALWKGDAVPRYIHDSFDGDRRGEASRCTSPCPDVPGQRCFRAKGHEGEHELFVPSTGQGRPSVPRRWTDEAG